jgi:hypothetical protein
MTYIVKSSAPLTKKYGYNYQLFILLKLLVLTVYIKGQNHLQLQENLVHMIIAPNNQEFYLNFIGITF